MICSEIAKCELVCANCHAVRTYERRLAESPRPEVYDSSSGVVDVLAQLVSPEAKPLAEADGGDFARSTW